MSDEYANPTTGQPYDQLSKQEYAAIQRRRPKIVPCDCYKCGKRINNGIDDAWFTDCDGKLERCCYDCRFADDRSTP